MIEVRTAGAGDGDALGEIHAAAWEAAYAPFFEPEFAAKEVEDRRTRWHARIADAHGTVLLAALDGRPLALSYAVRRGAGRDGRRSTAATAIPTAGAPASRRLC